MKLTPEQIEAVVAWMNEWEQLKDTVIPIRFKEDFSDKAIVDDGLFSQEQALNMGEVSMSAKIDHATIQYNQIWQPIPRLRWKRRIFEQKNVLQQLFIDGHGNEEWRNVEVAD